MRNRNHSASSKDTVRDVNGDVSKPSKVKLTSYLKQLLGFEVSDLTSWSSIVRLFNKPVDGSSLAVFRIMFGLMMLLDIPQERGLSLADWRWGDVNECRFPLLNFLKPLPLRWMYVVYLTMMTGAAGITAGFFYRISCLLFVLPYWYIFLLDKTVWNNHSYLYGLIGLILIASNANQCWSLDSSLAKSGNRKSSVPLWNYFLLRSQIFILYFIAGIKKLEFDWINGYSMPELSNHWVFSSLRFFMTAEQVDLWVIHRGGFLIDLLAGFALYFDSTRPVGTVIISLYHVMNALMFPIGMFPYVMLTTTTLFYGFNWPRIVILHLNKIIRPTWHPLTDAPRQTDLLQSATTKRQHVAAVSTICFVGLQLFLPFSHFLTPGYNNWTNGLYGYSWDMMVHSWNVQHVRIKYVDCSTGKDGYIKPDAWLKSANRWALHADTTKQYAMCIADRLTTDLGFNNVSLYFDIWCSLNGRFQQRMWDPRVDLVLADWSPFEPVKWSMPLLTDLSDWRTHLDSIVTDIIHSTNETEVVFVADFPGMTFDSYIPKDLSVANISTLKGTISVSLQNGSLTLLEEGNWLLVSSGQFISVTTLSQEPSCYQYTYINTTTRLAKHN